MFHTAAEHDKPVERTKMSLDPMQHTTSGKSLSGTLIRAHHLSA